MYLSAARGMIRCKVFLIRLRQSALKWFNMLPLRLIMMFTYMSSRFLAHFTTSKAKQKSITTLLRIK